MFKINPLLKNTILLATITFGFQYLMYFSTVIHYKNQIISEHVQFLNDQIPRLVAENKFLWLQVNKSALRKKSFEDRLIEFKPYIDFLNDDTKPKSIDDIIRINAYIGLTLDTPDLMNGNPFKHLNSKHKKQLEPYRILQFKNNIFHYLSAYMGVFGSDFIISDFSILDFWTKGKYHIYLNYHPEDMFQFPLKINGTERNENILQFKPDRIGMHTIDVSLTQFDSKGVEQKLDFKKEIMVVP